MDSQRRRPGRGGATHDGRTHWPGLSRASAWWGRGSYLKVAVLARSVEWIGMLDVFHPAQGAAIRGTRASVLGAWRAQTGDDGNSVTRRHACAGSRGSETRPPCTRSRPPTGCFRSRAASPRSAAAMVPCRGSWDQEWAGCIAKWFRRFRGC